MDKTFAANDATISNVAASYIERNRYIRRYLTDLLVRSLKKAVENGDIKKFVTGSLPSNILTFYKNTAGEIVRNKMKDLENIVKEKANKPVVFTLESKNPDLIQFDIEKLKRIYSEEVDASDYLLSTAVTKEQTELVEEVAVKLITTVKDGIGGLMAEYIAMVKENVKPMTETNEELDSYIMSDFEINDYMIEQGVINKFYSNNFSIDITDETDAYEFTKLVEGFNPDNVDLDKVDPELTDLAKEFIKELGDETLDDLKEKLLSGNFTDITPVASRYIRDLANLGLNWTYDLTLLTLSWIILVNGYNQTGDKKYLTTAAILEKVVKNTLDKFRKAVEGKLIAVGIKAQRVILIEPNYLKLLDKFKNLFGAIAGYVVENSASNTVYINEDMINEDFVERYSDIYNKYLAKQRYKTLVNNAVNIRNAYVLSFMKIAENMFDDTATIKKAIDVVKDFIFDRKIDELLEVEETSLRLFRDVLMDEGFRTVLAIVDTANKKFTNEDNANIFILLTTMNEVIFSLLKVIVIDTVEV